MKELKKHIFLSITEILIKHFLTSKYLTFSSYSTNYGRTIISGEDFSNKELLVELYDMLEDVYSLNNERVAEMLYDYFTLDFGVINSYYKIAMITQECYPNSYH